MSWVVADYDRQYWVEMPVREEWRETPWDNEKDWSRSKAHVLLAFNELPDDRRSVRRLSKMFVEYRRAFAESAPGREHYLYFSEPNAKPLSIHLWYGPVEGKRDEALRAHVRAESVDAMLPPQVEEISSDALGLGLRSLNHVLLEDQSVVANLWYAFRDEQHEIDLIAFASTEDLGRLAAAVPDFDDFIKGVSIYDDEDEEVVDETPPGRR